MLKELNQALVTVYDIMAQVNAGQVNTEFKFFYAFKRVGGIGVGANDVM